MRKVLISVIACVLLLSTLSVCALTVEKDENISSASQTYTITSLANGTIAVSAKNPPVIWEQPTLKAGDFMVRSSSLILSNATDKAQKIMLETVELPYESEDALRYLNHLTITVSSGNTVLYKGPYSRINDDEQFVMTAEMPADSQVAFNIQLSCDYRYTGEGFGVDDQIQWKFRSEAQPDESGATNDTASFANSVILEVALAVGLTVLLLAGITLYRRFANR